MIVNFERRDNGEIMCVLRTGKYGGDNEVILLGWHTEKRRASEDDKRRYPKQYADFKAKESA